MGKKLLHEGHLFKEYLPEKNISMRRMHESIFD